MRGSRTAKRRRRLSRRQRIWRDFARTVAGLLGLGLAVGAGLVAVAAFWPAAKVTADAQALARLGLARVGERLATVSVLDEQRRPVRVTVRGGAIWPVDRLPAGEKLTLHATVRRSGWAAWLVGRTEQVDADLETPEAHLVSTLLHPDSGQPVRLRFDVPVSIVAFKRRGAAQARASFLHPQRVVPTGVLATGKNRFGTVVIAAAARPWERLSRPVRVSWFPAGAHVQALVRPAPGSQITPGDSIELTLSQPVADVFGSARPTLSPPTPGSWTQAGINTLVFRPNTPGFGLGTHVELTLPVPARVVVGRRTRTLRALSWRVPEGSLVRLQQLLSQLGYLPLEWRPAGGDVPRTADAQAEAALQAPAGTFTWRYAGIPAPLASLWGEGRWTEMMQGAVMAFQNDQGLTVDGIAGPQVWRKLIAARLAGAVSDHAYSYVLVHRSVPQTLELWHAGQTILSARVNTGVPAAPTPYGTHPVFLHLVSATMSGENPDGSHYHDPGIRWISYFHGGEAIHGFNRGSYGFPQSVGCVEAPIATAGRIWPYTPIGTLVSIVP